jgi:hypothetical protein
MQYSFAFDGTHAGLFEQTPFGFGVLPFGWLHEMVSGKSVHGILLWHFAP